MSETEGLDKPSSEVAAMAEAWPVIDALVGGTLAMRKAAKTYLPPFESEEDESYKDRLGRSTLFPAFARTTEVLAAKPFSRPIKVTNVDANIESMFRNIDLAGTSLHAFSAQIMLACLRYGLHGIMVDAPRAEGLRTIADEKAAGVRPYMTQYPVDSILGWESERSAYGTFLTQVRLKEWATERTGRFTSKQVEQIRVLEPGKWETWRVAKAAADGAKQWVLFETGATNIDVVPFVFFYGLREDFGIGRPPLLELAHLNVEHWQSSSDQQNLLHTARVPILFAKGFGNSGDKITVGAKALTTARDEKAELKYVEHSGAAIEAGAKAIRDLEDRMRQIGAELLTERQGELTATEVNSRDEDNRSILQKVAEEFEASLETALALMSLWVGDKKADPKVELHKDFNTAVREPPAAA